MPMLVNLVSNSLIKIVCLDKKEAWTEINSELNLYLGSYAKLKDDIFIIGGFFHMHP